MAKKILYILSAVVLFAASGAAAVFTLSIVAPHPTQETARAADTNSVSETDSPANTATDNPTTTPSDQTDTDPGTPVSSETATNPAHDVQVKNTLARIVSLIGVYVANNRGALPNTPASLSNFTSTYLQDGILMNPATSKAYTLELGEAADTSASISFDTGTTCGDGGSSVIESTSRRSFTLFVTLPSGTPYCVAS